MEHTYTTFLVPKNFTVKQAMKRMTEIGQKVIFVIDAKKKLLGALSDGDIRKWIISGGSIREKIHAIYNKHPKTVRQDYQIAQVKELMLSYSIECIPVINVGDQVVNILTWDKVFSEATPIHKQPVRAQVVIMAGGRGTRLDPFTRILPKPLMPIGDKPVIEVIVEKFTACGISEFFVTLNHKSRMIKAYFEDIPKEYTLHFVEEKTPLGTAGALRLLKDRLDSPFLVTNCDTLIECDWSETIAHHKTQGNSITIVVSCKHHVIPYGICEINNKGTLKSMREKPEYDFLVNTGMYVMDKAALKLIPAHRACNMNELIDKARKQRLKIGVFPVSDNSWVDVGQWEEYRKAVAKLKID